MIDKLNKKKNISIADSQSFNSLYYYTPYGAVVLSYAGKAASKVMEHHRLIILLVNVLSITTSNSPSLNDWSCGLTADDKARLYRLLDGKCSKYRAPVNFCCSLHMDCYKLQLGQRNCDSKLCLCVQKYSENNDSCAPAIVRSCKDARMYGASTYEGILKVAGGNVTKTPGIALKGESARLFREVFEECNDTTLSIKTCALNFNICVKKERSSVCRKYLSECITCGAKLQNSSTCEVALEKLRSSLGKPEDSAWSGSQKLMIWMTFAEILLTIILTGLAIVVPIRRKPQRMVSP
ncbi:hypothetical protein Y032_0220g2532 [Ancylostoma ceylanicum]|uniref:Uncharacterized protein n=1 Tax=Ancylostoma ceylanicum TaxID=53326 RepID=A0A016SJG6_9BILA|nr:hypothetical protein Y032_0220g2532 [Ancylostoma ceylanicum]